MEPEAFFACGALGALRPGPFVCFPLEEGFPRRRIFITPFEILVVYCAEGVVAHGGFLERPGQVVVLVLLVVELFLGAGVRRDVKDGAFGTRSHQVHFGHIVRELGVVRFRGPAEGVDLPFSAGELRAAGAVKLRGLRLAHHNLALGLQYVTEILSHVKF